MYNTRRVFMNIEINEQGDVFVVDKGFGHDEIQIGRFCQDAQLVGNAIAKYLNDYEDFDVNMELHNW